MSVRIIHILPGGTLRFECYMTITDCVKWHTHLGLLIHDLFSAWVERCCLCPGSMKYYWYLLPNVVHLPDGFHKETVVFTLSFQMTLTDYTQSVSSRGEGCSGIPQWDFIPQWEWVLKLTEMRMEKAQRYSFMFPSDSAPRWRWTEGDRLEEEVSREKQCGAEQVSRAGHL